MFPEERLKYTSLIDISYLIRQFRIERGNKISAYELILLVFFFLLYFLVKIVMRKLSTLHFTSISTREWTCLGMEWSTDQKLVSSIRWIPSSLHLALKLPSEKAFWYKKKSKMRNKFQSNQLLIKPLWRWMFKTISSTILRTFLLTKMLKWGEEREDRDQQSLGKKH